MNPGLRSAASRLALALAALSAGCSPPDAARSPSVPAGIPPADSAFRPAAEADSAPGSSPPWVVFQPSRAAMGMHGGPDWRFATPGLPARSRDGRLLLVPARESDLGGTPNLELLMLRVEDDSLVPGIPILSAGEFLAAQAGQAYPERVGHAYRELAERVSGRVRAANIRIGEEGWIPLPACALRDSSHAAHPPCSMDRQRIDCGEVSLVYRQQRLEAVLAGGKGAAVYRPRWAPPPAQDATLGRVPVSECFAGAWFDAARGLFAGLLLNECQQGGDGCLVQPRWHAVPLRP